jgi:hypothetical protein
METVVCPLFVLLFVLRPLKVGPRETDAELLKELDLIIIKITNNSAEPMSNADKHSHKALMVQLVTFGLGIILFCIFGVLQIA